MIASRRLRYRAALVGSAGCLALSAYESWASWKRTSPLDEGFGGSSVNSVSLSSSASVVVVSLDAVVSAGLRNRLGLKNEEIAVLAVLAALRAGILDMVCFLRGISTEEMRGRMLVDMLKISEG